MKTFAENNFLKLNVQKCEVVVFDRGQRCDVLPECEIDSSVLPSGYEGKCLGYWWRGDLLASRAVVLWKRTFRRPGEPFFTLEALGLFRVTLVNKVSSGDMCGSSSSIWL